MLHTDKQTNRQTDKRRQKHIPPGGGQLPVEIKDSENITQFKKRLETLFGESYDMNQKTINEQYKT